jgi:hypothetical protein
MIAWKLCDPFGDWRTDAPESLPRCCLCAAVIGVDDPYAYGPPRLIACCPCAGFTPGATPRRALRAPSDSRGVGPLDRGFARSSS